MKQVKRVRTWNWSLEWKPQSSDQVWSYFMKVKAELRVVSVSSLVTLYCKCNALRTLCTTICWNLWFLYIYMNFFFPPPWAVSLLLWGQWEEIILYVHAPLGFCVVLHGFSVWRLEDLSKRLPANQLSIIELVMNVTDVSNLQRVSDNRNLYHGCSATLNVTLNGLKKKKCCIFL